MEPFQANRNHLSKSSQLSDNAGFCGFLEPFEPFRLYCYFYTRTLLYVHTHFSPLRFNNRG